MECEEVMPRKSKSFDNLGIKLKDIYNNSNDITNPSPIKVNYKPPITSKILKILKTPSNPNKTEVCCINLKNPNAFLKIRKDKLNGIDAKSFLNTKTQVF